MNFNEILFHYQVLDSADNIVNLTATFVLPIAGLFFFPLYKIFHVKVLNSHFHSNLQNRHKKPRILAPAGHFQRVHSC